MSGDEDSRLGTEVSVVSDEIAGLRDDLSDMEAQRRQQAETSRVQRAHLIVALGIVSAFATLFDPNDYQLKLDVFWNSREPIYALLVHAVLFLLYIPLHLYAITAYTLPSETFWDKVHDLVLPGVNLLLLSGSLPLVLMIVLGLDFNLIPDLRIPTHQLMALTSLQFGFAGLPGVYLITEGVYASGSGFFVVAATPTTYILVEIITLAYPASRYAREFQENMSEIQTGSKSRRLHLGTGTSGDSARIEITNSNDETVAGDDIRFEIDTPRGVVVRNVEHATESDSGYRLVDDLGPGDSIRLPIEIDEIPGVKYDDYRGEEVSVDIYIDGEKVAEETFTL